MLGNKARQGKARHRALRGGAIQKNNEAAAYLGMAVFPHRQDTEADAAQTVSKHTPKSRAQPVVITVEEPVQDAREILRPQFLVPFGLSHQHGEAARRETGGHSKRWRQQQNPRGRKKKGGCSQPGKHQGGWGFWGAWLLP